jgi:hypothetical protein
MYKIIKIKREFTTIFLPLSQVTQIEFRSFEGFEDDEDTEYLTFLTGRLNENENDHLFTFLRKDREKVIAKVEEFLTNDLKVWEIQKDVSYLI